MSETHDEQWFLRPSAPAAPDIYNYHPIWGEFIGKSKANPSPRRFNDWLYPANSTLLAPPEVGENEVAVFSDNKWTIKPDYRGNAWYDENGQEVTIDFIGNPADQGLLKEKPELPEPDPIYPQLTARQIRLALNDVSMLDKVEPMIAKLPDEDRGAAQIEWQHATTFEHDHWLIQAMALAFGIPQDQFNDLWLWASKL